MFCSFLASGDSYGGLGARFRIVTSTVSQIIPEVCDAIWEVISPTEMAPPTLKKCQEIEWLWKTMEFSQLCGGYRWQACCDTEPSQRRQFVP